MKMLFQRNLKPSLLLFFSFFYLQTYSQVGVTLSRYTQDMPDWEAVVFQSATNQDFLKNGYSVGVDYWMKPLKNYRLELYPELVVSTSHQKIFRDLQEDHIHFSSAGLNLNMNLYLFNFYSDCDCPTFSKQESFIEKGFFIQISPGYHYFRGTYEVSEGEEVRKNTMNDFVPKFGLGAGLDIGISDFITLTPTIKYDRYFKADWTQLNYAVLNDPLINTIPDVSNINRLTYGLHIGIRLNP